MDEQTEVKTLDPVQGVHNRDTLPLNENPLCASWQSNSQYKGGISVFRICSAFLLACSLKKLADKRVPAQWEADHSPSVLRAGLWLVLKHWLEQMMSLQHSTIYEL